MPHALFLGSSLASVDRLDMVPHRPSPVEPRKSFKMPSMQLLDGMRRRLPGRSSRRQRTEEESFELSVHVPGETSHRDVPDLPSSSRIIPEVDYGKPVLSDQAGFGENHKVGQFEAAIKQYEKDLKAFDRIRWVDLHVRHATVRQISWDFPLRSFAPIELIFRLTP
jgi:metal iron transporter